MSEELLDVIGLPEFFVDGFTDFTVIDGILRCTGYRKQRGADGVELVPAFRLQMTLAGAADARNKTTEALNTPASIMVEPMKRERVLS